MTAFGAGFDFTIGRVLFFAALLAVVFGAGLLTFALFAGVLGVGREAVLATAFFAALAGLAGFVGFAFDEAATLFRAGAAFAGFAFVFNGFDDRADVGELFFAGDFFAAVAAFFFTLAGAIEVPFLVSYLRRGQKRMAQYSSRKAHWPVFCAV